MSTFNAYFKRHFLSSWAKPIIFTVLGLITILTQYVKAHDNYVNSGATSTQTLFGSIIIIACITAVVTPISEFTQFNNKRNLDTIFSLPISKTKILMAHYITGITHICITITAVYIVWLITWVYAPFTLMNEAYVFIFYPFVILAAVLVYTIYSFVFLQANTTLDGCIFMYLHTFVFIIILCRISTSDIFQFYDRNLLSNMGSNASYFALLIVTLNLFNNVSKPYSYSDGYTNIRFKEFSINRYETALIWFFVILAIICFILMIILFNKKSPVNVGNISNSWFGYKTLGPIHSILGGLTVKAILVSLFSELAPLFSFILILVPIITFLGYMVYRRGIKLKWVDIVIIAMSAMIIF